MPRGKHAKLEARPTDRIEFAALEIADFDLRSIFAAMLDCRMGV
jgi:hypothetical protein